MIKKKFLQIFLLVFFVSVLKINITSQIPQNADQRELNSGETLTRDITGKEIHRYKFDLEANEVFQIRVEPKSDDLSLKLSDEKGNVLAMMDSTDGKESFEILTFIASKPNDFILEISRRKNEKSIYTLKRETAREATESERISFSDFLIKEAENLSSIAYKILDESAKLGKGKKEAVSRKGNESLLKAIALQINAALLIENTGKDSYRILYFLLIGRDYSHIKDYQNSITYLNKALILNNSDKYRAIKFQHRILAEIGTVYHDSESEIEAIEYYKKAILDYRDNWSSNDNDLLDLTLAKLDYLLGTSSDYGTYWEINETQAQLIDIAKKNNLRDVEQFLRIHLGKSFYDMGQYDKAIASYNEASKIDENNNYAQRSVTQGLATIFLRTGRLDEAEKYYNKSMNLAMLLEDDRNVIVDKLNIACVYARTDDPAKNRLAIKIFKELFTELEKWQSSPDNDKIQRQQYTRFVLETSFYYALAYRKLGDYNSAILTLKKSIEGSKEFKMGKYESRAFVEIGLNYLSINNPESALREFKNAYILSKQAKVRDEEIAALDGMMRAWAIFGNAKPAIFYGKQSVNLLQQTRNEIKNSSLDFSKDFLRDNLSTYRRLADLLFEAGRFVEAEEVLEMLKQEEFSKFVRRDPEEISKLGQRLEPTSAEKPILEKYTVLAENLAKIGFEYEKIKRENGGSCRKNDARCQNLKQEVEDANTAFRVFLDQELVKEFNKIPQRNVKEDFAKEKSRREILQSENAVSIYTLVGEKRLRLFLTTSQVQLDRKKEITPKELNKKIRDFRQALTNSKVDPRPIGKELYDILIRPIEKQIEDSGAKTLLFSLDGMLRYIPMAALWDGEKYLIEKYQIVLLTSTTKERLRESNQPDWKIFGGGVTQDSEISAPERRRFGALPAVETELNSIIRDENEQGIFDGKKFLDRDFTKEILEINLSSNAFNVLHLATHFNLGRDSAASFLLMGNNQTLTLKQISDSPDIEFGGIDLVVLSACETAFGSSNTTGEGDEIDSSATFFELKGARSVMASLWSVADQSTSELMIAFYSVRRENPKLSKAKALSLAQKKFLDGKYKTGEKPVWRGAELAGVKNNSLPDFKTDENAPFAHPYYWSPFVLIGNWK